MKKIITLVVVLLMVSSKSFGAVSDDVYVRKDVFDVHMQSINAKLDMMLEEMKAQRKDINDLMKAVSVMSGRIDGLDKRIDGQQNYLYLVLVILGIIVALPTVQKMLQGREERKEARKSFITLEDVERLIDAKMAGKAQA